VRTRQDTWYAAAQQQVYSHLHAPECDALKPLGLAFVRAEWTEVAPYQDIYAKAGVRRLAPIHVVTALTNFLQKQKGQPPLLTSAELLRIFRYFLRHDLGEDVRTALRGLPLCRTAVTAGWLRARIRPTCLPADWSWIRFSVT
jgi:hypothetical protein